MIKNRARAESCVAGTIEGSTAQQFNIARARRRATGLSGVVATERSSVVTRMWRRVALARPRRSVTRARGGIAARLHCGRRGLYTFSRARGARPICFAETVGHLLPCVNDAAVSELLLADSPLTEPSEGGVDAVAAAGAEAEEDEDDEVDVDEEVEDSTKPAVPCCLQHWIRLASMPMPPMPPSEKSESRSRLPPQPPPTWLLCRNRSSMATSDSWLNQ